MQTRTCNHPPTHTHTRTHTHTQTYTYTIKTVSDSYALSALPSPADTSAE